MALRKSHLYASLWQSCDQLRGGMDASQYKDYVLTLVFMKYVSDKYAGTDDRYSDITVPLGGSFADMVALKGSKEIGDGINIVIRKLADANDFLLKGVIDQADFNDESKLGRGKEMTDRLTKLIGIFEQLDFRANRAQGDDLLGDAYEYLMRHFATQSGKSKGQFYTPAEVSRIMAQVIGIGPDTARNRAVYDPTCGSGSLLIKAADEAPNGLTIYGQEMDVATWTMARMNMILHGHTAADVEHGNTLAAPSFTDGPGQLMRFDFAVANPPFSTKAWSNGLDPAHDEFRRFDYGIPPAKNGDYAFLLHFVASLKSTGKGAIILPLGVLFRSNREADIRRELVRRRLIRGIIGLPANLFYGTGIPACIVVIDKEDSATRDGIFMVDASRGFRKDGAKNRLRERDIHSIVDVFNEQKETPGYARMVPLTEIASVVNDYNLNISRYIDSSEPEDLHDLGAHLYGGIPNRDIDALGCFWEVFPSLRQHLFALGCREGYSDAQIEADEVQTAVLKHEEFRTYQEQVRGVFTDWKWQHSSHLHKLGVGDSPKVLMQDLSEDLLHRFTGLLLLDRYDVYQCLTDYWDEVMQDDVYLIVTEGWVEAARPRVLAGGRRQGAVEVPDLTVKQTKYKMDLLPPELVAARYFAGEQSEVENLWIAEERIRHKMEGFVEENSGEDGLLDGATTDAGNVTQTAVKVRLKKIGDDPADLDERDALDICLNLMKAHAKAKKTAKDAQAKLNAKVLARYATLGSTEVANIVVDAKWMASIEDAIGRQIEHLMGGLVDRIRVLEGRYAEALPELVERLEKLEAKVKPHLRYIKQVAMHQLLNVGTRPPEFSGEWEMKRLSEAAVVTMGQSPPSISYNVFGDGLPLIQGKADIVDRNTTERIWTTDPSKHCAAGDIVLTVRAPVGSVARASSDACLGRGVCGLKPLADSQFLYYALVLAEAKWEDVEQGSTFSAANSDQVAGFPVAVPVDRMEQQAIATVLTDIDDEIAALERRLEKTRAIKQGMMQQLLTGSIRLPIPDCNMEDDDAHDA